MIVVKWTPIQKTEWIPPFGQALEEHINAYQNPRVRYASCSAWGLLYRILTEQGLGSGIVSFQKYGKPVFRDSDLFFSLSHSRKICGAAISDHPVGVDVELCRDHYKQSMIERSLSERERASFDGDFTRLWCRKESLAKMTGTGLMGYPNTIDTCRPGIEFYEEKVVFGEDRYWLISAMALDDTYNKTEKKKK